MMAGSIFRLLCVLFLIVCLALPTYPNAPTGTVMIFHAGSMSAPLRAISLAFEEAYPGVRVLREAAGSRISARKISDLNRACDVMVSADYAVIDTLLIPEHAAWNILFAGNELAIAFTEKSRYAGELDADNWPQLLLREDIHFGRSDPNTDPCGYRTVLALKLAEKHYAIPGLADSFLERHLRFMRPKETDLLALLETHTVDYIFIYRSVAEQHGLNWLALPDEINLKRAELAEWYATASVEISGTSPGTTMTQQGEPMVYGVTSPRNAPNPEAALVFVAFLLEEGIAILEKNGQPGVVPSLSTTYHAIPDALKRFALKP